MSKPAVSIVMGSDSDLEIMREAGKALEGFGIEYELDVTSAHRSPDRTAEFARRAAGRGIRIIIAGAGGAAHLAGVIAAHTTLPVIGVPIPSTSLNGLDSLLATVQMPAGIPVATVAIGKPGATNAGILAAQILGIADSIITQKLEAHKTKLAQSVEEKSRKLRGTS
ncbi:MAG: 5-(carboxyamino)imidazole ribonucleotide mutase [Acidobacteria bacterium]|nr:MAG: 5-(carboxyamino)imidazole ribonucleotide mutase [Acidobacteriota bacterium]PYV73786.1 MAG: 5-(carboxyamino)imidazole ribonucleotide mutase [Acidobacteriota bacterium]PYV74568.1 MAG: 5-(carboxyamino)imidazole ribonucleotide mutase [Acidobacteriota bacterium]